MHALDFCLHALELIRDFYWLRGIMAPKEPRGWGLKEIHLFSKAFATKNFWGLIGESSLWYKVIQAKSFLGFSIIDWFRVPDKYFVGLIVWKALVRTFPLIFHWLAWCVGNGRSIRIGCNP